MKKRFRASPGAPFGDKKAQIYGAEVDRLSKRNLGRLRPVEVVAAARADKSPLRDYFEWDDKMAGHSWRLQQARQLINHLVIEIPDNGETRSVKAFYSYTEGDPEEPKNRYYVTVERVARDEAIRETLVKRAIAEILAWQARHRELTELAEIFGVVEKTKQRLESNNRA